MQLHSLTRVRASVTWHRLPLQRPVPTSHCVCSAPGLARVLLVDVMEKRAWIFFGQSNTILGFPGQEPACQCRLDVTHAGSIPGSGRSPRAGHGSPPWYSCLENLMDRAGWRAAAHRVSQSRTRLQHLAGRGSTIPPQSFLQCILRSFTSCVFLFTILSSWDALCPLFLFLLSLFVFRKSPQASFIPGKRPLIPHMN